MEQSNAPTYGNAARPPAPPAGPAYAGNSFASGQPSGGTSHVLYMILLVLSLGVLGVGIYLAMTPNAAGAWPMIAGGAICTVAVLALWPLASAVESARCADAARQAQLLTLLNDRLQQMAVLLNVVSEQQLLSDRAKTVAFRDKDRDALRRAIREDLARKDYEAALALVTDMDTTFGYKQEADRIREEITRHRNEALTAQIRAAASQIEGLCRQEKWTDALREAERLGAQFPGVEAVSNLPQEIEARRQQHKKGLIDSWNDALGRKDVDGAIEILKKLDTYLTRAEGEAMADSARGIFQEKLNNLRMQFTLAYQDHKYTEAIRVGEIVTRDFPNSGIAREIRDVMDSLRKKAGEADLARV